jgi:hypothetical protein
VVVRHSLFWLGVFLCFPVFAAQTVVSFDALFTGPGQNVHDALFSTNAATFVNSYTPKYDSWGGFAFSTVSNVTDGSWLNQYAAAQAHSNAYAVGYDGGWDPAPEIRFDLPCAPKSVRINNTTYAALSIRHGYAPARAFTNGDFFVLTLTARDRDDRVVATTNHYLADFRGGQTFIQTNWSTLDLSWMSPGVVSLLGTMETTDMSGPWANTPAYFALADFTYAYAGLDSGIAATNPAILCWADGVAAYAPGDNVSNQFLDATRALGPAEEGDGFLGSTNGVVSLGDQGAITLTFPVPITDGPGPDFVVFENAFAEDFLEFAFVAVSSDGVHFTNFPCHVLSTNPVEAYAGSGTTESAAIGGLAGKHLQGTGTPFDLRALAGTPGLDVRRITHVRLVDVLGDGSVSDDYGHPIYDPFPTVGSGGFDLDAVGVLRPLVEISTGTNAPPELPGYTTVKEYTPTLDPPTWTNALPPTNAPGFFRYRLVK